MTETVEKVITRTYTVKDLRQLFGEGKDNVTIKMGYTAKDGAHYWLIKSGEDAILRIEIREPIDKETKK